MGCPGESEFGGLTRPALRERSPADGAPRPLSAELPGVPRCVRDAGTSSSSRRGGDGERGAGTGIHREGHGRGVPVYQEQVAAQVVVQAQAVPLSERDVYKMAAPAGRIWRKHVHLHVRTDSSTLWHLLDKALQVKHPRTVVHRSTVRTQLRLMNGLRSDSAAWAVRRWYRRAAGSVEDGYAEVAARKSTRGH